MQFLSLDELTAASDVIAIGNVLSVNSKWEKNHTDIATIATIQVTTYLKSGNSRPAQLNLSHPGGKPPLFQGKVWNMVVPGVPTFFDGQKALYFLRRNGRFYELVGWEQGLFRVQKNSSGHEIVVRNLDEINFVNRTDEATLKPMTLNQLVDQIHKKLR